jgi:methanogenesis imperfect marker protein 11
MTRYLVKIGNVPLELKPSSAAAGIEAVQVKDNEVTITYAGLGGGGVGATCCRAQAAGVVRFETTPSGGGKAAKGTIVVPRRKRVLVGIDDTDTKETGAT